MLPEKVYETLRWLIAIVIPAVSVLIATLVNVWDLDIPAEQICLTLDAIALFLGAIFGISKIQHDKEE